VGVGTDVLTFRMRIVPKSAKHAEVVRRAASDVESYPEQWE
jgi:hypothetical protein